MKYPLIICFSGASAFFSPHASAQQVLACPTGLYGLGTIPSGPITANSPLFMWVRELIGSGPAAGAWDFKPENFVVSGFQITATAIGVQGCGFFYCPAPTTQFGPVPAGNYTVTINATATNVTPNVACPPFTVPLTVLPGAVAAVNEPVPIGPKWLAALAALLLGVGGATLTSHRRQHSISGKRSRS